MPTLHTSTPSLFSGESVALAKNENKYEYGHLSAGVPETDFSVSSIYIHIHF